MDINKLKLFVDIAKTGNITSSAERLGYTQSAVSHAIAKLEAETSLSLLKRNNQGVQLTRDGALLLPKVESLLFQYENLLQEIESMKCLEKGRLSIGSYASMARTFLPSVIKEFHKLYPLIEISIQECAYKELCDAVHNQTVDLAFMSHPDSLPSGTISPLSSFQFIPIKKDPLYLFSSLDFFCKTETPDYAVDRPFLLSSLKHYPFISGNKDFDCDIIAALERYSIPYNKTIQCNDEHTMIKMVEMGLGLGIISKMFPQNGAKIRYYKTEPALSRSLGIAFLNEEQLTCAASAFIKLASMVIQDKEKLFAEAPSG
jgi:transcriptional regulator, lysR family